MLCFFPVVFSLAYYSTRQGCWNRWDMGAIVPPSLLPNQIFVGIEANSSLSKLKSVILSTIIFKRHWIIPPPHRIYEPTYSPARRGRQSHGWGHAQGGIQQLRGPNFIQFWPQPPSTGQKWTFYLLSTLCHVTQRGLSTYTHPPLLVHVVIEWPYDCSCAGEASAFLRLWGTRPLSTMRSKPIPSRNSICRRKIISVDIQWWKKIVKFLNCFSALWDLTSFCLYRKRTENFARE